MVQVQAVGGEQGQLRAELTGVVRRLLLIGREAGGEKKVERERQLKGGDLSKLTSLKFLSGRKLF